MSKMKKVDAIFCAIALWACVVPPMADHWNRYAGNFPINAGEGLHIDFPRLLVYLLAIWFAWVITKAFVKDKGPGV